MATIVHRRPAPRRAPEPARGPGGSFDSLTWVGYASLVAAFGFLVFGLRPLTDMGDPRMWDWALVPDMVTRPLRSAAILALPAALELGVPGARRITPWLMRGTVLLALEELLRPAVRAARSAVIDSQLMDDATSFDTSPAWLALTLVSLGLTFVGIAGAWSLSDGLTDAGGRPRRGLVLGIVVPGTALALATYVRFLGVDSSQGVGASEMVLLASNLLSIALGFVDNVLWLMIGVHLIAGLMTRQRPWIAWAIGALAGAGFLVVRFVSPLAFGWVQPDAWVGYVLSFAGTASWLLLALAFAAGLGRGRVRRRPRPLRVHLFVLNPVA